MKFNLNTRFAGGGFENRGYDKYDDIDQLEGMDFYDDMENDDVPDQFNGKVDLSQVTNIQKLKNADPQAQKGKKKDRKLFPVED